LVPSGTRRPWPLALGEEGVTLRLRLLAGHQLEEALALLLQPFVERQVDGGADRVRRDKRASVRGLSCEAATALVKIERSPSRRQACCRRRAIGEAGVSPPAPCGRTPRRQSPGFDDFLIGVLLRLGSTNRIAAKSFDAEFRNDRARRRWVPPPGSRPSFTSGRPNLASLWRAKMAGRRLEAAAERRAMNGGDHRFGLPSICPTSCGRRLRRLAEFVMWRRDKGAAAQVSTIAALRIATAL